VPIERITDEEATAIIRTREPLGQFYHIDKTGPRPVYVAIDNSDGDAWVEEFWTLASAKRYLEGKPCRDRFGQYH
jgi:hypothetical protein